MTDWLERFPLLSIYEAIQWGILDELPGALDLEKGLALKKRGMGVAAANGESWLDVLRPIAIQIGEGRSSERCDTDDVTIYCTQHEMDVPKGPFWGSLFKTKDWVFTGDRRMSAIPSNHGREIKIWRLA